MVLKRNKNGTSYNSIYHVAFAWNYVSENEGSSLCKVITYLLVP